MTDTGLVQLRREIDRAGYYPHLVAGAMEDALAAEPVRSSCVHQETTFDADEVRRHVTVLALTPTRLVVGHADDHPADEVTAKPYVTASTETVSLRAVTSVVVQRVVTEPTSTRKTQPPAEITLTVGWGAVRRIDLEPASCADLDCEADHGYTGTASSDDISLRVSAAAEGPDAVARAVAFAAELTRATASSRAAPSALHPL